MFEKRLGNQLAQIRSHAESAEHAEKRHRIVAGQFQRLRAELNQSGSVLVPIAVSLRALRSLREIISYAFCIGVPHSGQTPKGVGGFVVGAGGPRSENPQRREYALQRRLG